jgi:SAM-dependent methyltransferase
MSQQRLGDVYADYSRFYDLYVGDRADDIPLYLEYAASSTMPILEIGAGTGRLTLPMASAGYQVVAVDISPSMLAILEAHLAELPDTTQKRVRVVHADMLELDLGETFDFVLVPFFTFNYLLTPETQIAALNRLGKHLSESGRLVLDLFVPPNPEIDSVLEPKMRMDAVDPANGNRVRLWTSARVDAAARIEHRTQRFEVTRPDGTSETTEINIERRFFLPGELERVAESHGLRVRALFTGYNDERPRPDSVQLVYVLGHA